MSTSNFVYVTYIRTSPEKLWHALKSPEFTKKFWVETWQECDWKKGSAWKIMISDGRVADAGEVLEIIPEKKLVLSWRNEFKPELKLEGYSQMTYEIEKMPSCVKLTITHTMDKPESKFIKAISNGWPMIMASLKSLLETGEPLAETLKWPKDK